ncbi:MAG TPA: translation elongation factor-like protein [Chloroflexota bacterium]|nr:translation elongation factor-like protein [Chloroflexota bacterium]
MAEVEVGVVNDFFAQPVVAGIDLSGELRVGDTILIKGHTTDLQVRVDSMQVDRQEVQVGQPGQSVGVKVPERVRRGDRVYRLEAEGGT